MTPREIKNAQNRKHYAKHRERILAKQKQYYAANRKKIVAVNAEYQRKPEVKKRRWYLAKLRDCGVSIPVSASL